MTLKKYSTDSILKEIQGFKIVNVTGTKHL